MSIHDAFEDQRREVDDLLLPAAQAVRARGEARRRRRTVATVVAVLVVIGTVTSAVAMLRRDAPAAQPAAGPTCVVATSVTTSSWVDPLSRRVRIFMRPEASAAEISAVDDALRAAPVVASYSYENQDEALAKFRELYACNPDLLAHTRVADLPPSFDVMLRDPAGYLALAAAVQTDAGVELLLRVPE